MFTRAWNYQLKSNQVYTLQCWISVATINYLPTLDCTSKSELVKLPVLSYKKNSPAAGFKLIKQKFKSHCRGFLRWTQCFSQRLLQVVCACPFCDVITRRNPSKLEQSKFNFAQVERVENTLALVWLELQFQFIER